MKPIMEVLQKLRVYALYRVSTLGQVDKDDIPMQRQACREFAEEKGWSIVKEYTEKGISGYKVSANDRDAIQSIRSDALAGKFDILLVFMFDRLGRRDDETPFVVEWFCRNNIQVWSVMEGQQQMDSHVDKLMNYIRYWQASGESEKTSIRTKTRLGQLTVEGYYTGGSIPFGYRTVSKGRLNKRNQAVLDLEVNEQEAAIVELMFRKYADEGYGAVRLSRYLHEKGITGRNGKGFPNTSINRMIKNPIYTGILRNGDSQSEPIESLRIIGDDLFQRAQHIMKERINPHSDIPLNCKGKSLLVGKVYCAHCGNILTLTTSGRKKYRPDGTVEREARARYQCHYNIRHPGECDGQSGYGMTKLDGIVDQVIRVQLSKITAARGSEVLQKQQEREIRTAKQRVEILKEALAEKESMLKDYRAETIKVIRGTSKLGIDLLNSLIEETQEDIRLTQLQAKEAEYTHASLLVSSKELKKEYNKLLTWADLYDQSTFEAKKMIAAQLIKSVHVGRDYNIEVVFNVSFEEFQQAELSGENCTKSPLGSHSA